MLLLGSLLRARRTCQTPSRHRTFSSSARAWRPEGTTAIACCNTQRAQPTPAKATAQLLSPESFSRSKYSVTVRLADSCQWLFLLRPFPSQAALSSCLHHPPHQHLPCARFFRAHQPLANLAPSSSWEQPSPAPGQGPSSRPSSSVSTPPHPSRTDFSGRGVSACSSGGEKRGQHGEQRDRAGHGGW